LAVQLTIEDARMLLNKYVQERTPIVGFYFGPTVKTSLRGRVDSISETGLVIRDDGDNYVIIDISGTEYFELGDDRDLAGGMEHLKGQFSSSLSLMIPGKGIVGLFEIATDKQDRREQQ
jgi:hypothetical protein